MNEFEASLKDLLNNAVDTELAERPHTQPFTRPSQQNRPRLGALAAWRMPVIAAAIAGIIVTGTTIALEKGSSPHGQRFGPGSNATPLAPIASSPTKSPKPRGTQATNLGSLSAGAIQSAGQAGLSTWTLGTTGIARSSDGGATWTTDSLPAGVASSKVQTIAATTDGGLFLAVPSSRSVVIYHQIKSNGAWTGTTLTPTWPVRSQLTGPPSSTVITPGPGSLVTAVASLSAGSTTSAITVFTSTDGGASFAERPSGFTTTLKNVAFTSSSNGVAIQGRIGAQVGHTGDGGQTWTNVTLATPSSGSTAEYEAPIIDSRGIEIPAIIQDGDFTAHVSFYRSNDGGATFPTTTGQQLTIPSADDQYGLNIAAYGEIRWVMPQSGGKLYISNDDGGTWTTVLSPTLPAGGMLNLSNGQQATIVTESDSCTGVKTGCTSQIRVYATADGGLTWRQR